MKETAASLCDMAILLYHVEEMKAKGVVTELQAARLKRIIRQRHRV